jgi:hypothetical protein
VFPIPVQMLEALTGQKTRENFEVPVPRSREPVVVR